MTFEWALKFPGRILGPSWALPGQILGYFVWIDCKRKWLKLAPSVPCAVFSYAKKAFQLY